MLRKNLIANYLGQGWVALMGLAFIPVYIKYLGLEGWGLVALMSTLQAWLLLLDAGLTPAVSREMARFTGGQLSAQAVRYLLRTLEGFYAIIAALVVGSFTLASPWMASHWLTAKHLPVADTTWALVAMGGVLAGRLVEQGYRGILRGLHHHVWLNGVEALLATFRWAGAAGVIAIQPSLTAFFFWQVLASLLSLCVLSREARRVLPPAPLAGRFDFQCLWRLRRFAGGMAMVTLLALGLTQIDKLFLSALLPLDEYGVYMLAATLAGGLSFLVMPATLAVGPRLAQLVAQGDEAGVANLFHKASQWVAAIIVPVALTMVLFSRDVLWVWTGDPVLADRSAPLLRLLALGTLLNAFMHIPYQTQLAYGWTGLAVRANAIAVAVLLPAIVISVPEHGAIAAAWIWCLLNAGYVVLVPHFMHDRLLKGEKWQWYWHIVLKPAAISTFVLLSLRPLFPSAESGRLAGAIFLTLAATLGFLTALGGARVTRLCFFGHPLRK